MLGDLNADRLRGKIMACVGFFWPHSLVIHSSTNRLNAALFFCNNV